MDTKNNRNMEETQGRDKALKNNMLLTFIAVLVVIVLVALAGFIFFRPKEDIIIGQAEVDEVRISGKVPGRITEYLVEEGQSVRQGDTLVRIYSPEVYAKLEQAEAARSAAMAQSQKAQAGARKEMKEGAFEMWQKAKAGVEIAQKSFDRIAKLYKEGVVPAQKYDEVEAQLNAMKATERAARSQYDMAMNGTQWEDKAAAKALVDKAAGAISEVDAYLKEGALISPIDGVVSDIFPHKGELVGSGAPIMNISDTTTLHVIFTIREDKLNKVRHNTVLKAYIPALNDREVDVRVTKMKDMGEYAAWKATKPTGQIDVRTFEVTAKPVNSVEGLVSGMSVVLKKGQL